MNETTRIGRWLCRHGLHRWRVVSGIRHAHVECRGCHARQVWVNYYRVGGYQPYDPNWGAIINGR